MEKIFQIKKQITAKKISTLKCIESVNCLLQSNGNVGDVVLLEQHLVCEYEDAVSYHQELLRYMYKGVRILENLGNVVYTCRSDINSYIWNTGDGVSSILPNNGMMQLPNEELHGKMNLQLLEDRDLQSPDSLLDESFHEDEDDDHMQVQSEVEPCVDSLLNSIRENVQALAQNECNEADEGILS